MTVPEVNNSNRVDYIMRYEGDDDFSPLDFIGLFSHLISTGLCWRLQGHYGRVARDLIDNDLIDVNGAVNMERIKELL